MPIRRRPRRSNRSLTTERELAATRVIYWTASRLQRLLRRIIKNDHQEWFAARVRELKSWPLRTKEQILDDASRINPRRLMDGRWAWPKRELEIQRELLKSAPEEGIDVDELRKALAEMPTGAGAEPVNLIADSELLWDTTVPLDTGLPQPKEIGTPLLRRIKRLQRWLGWRDPVPRANLKSPMGWD